MSACWYCQRTETPLERCCDAHPADVVCADRGDCAKFLIGQPGLGAQPVTQAAS